MHESTFDFGELEIVALTAHNLVGDSYRAKLVAMQDFAAYVRDLSDHRLAELSGLFAASHGGVHFLNAHGHSENGAWHVEDQIKEFLPIDEVMRQHTARAWLLLVCNEGDYRLNTQQPSLYPLDAIYVPSKIVWDCTTRTYRMQSNRGFRFVLQGAKPCPGARREEFIEALADLDEIIGIEKEKVKNSPYAIPF